MGRIDYWVSRVEKKSDERVKLDAHVAPHGETNSGWFKSLKTRKQKYKILFVIDNLGVKMAFLENK